MGIVTAPVVATFATVLPDIIPIIPLDTTATLATPPVDFPAKESAKFMKLLSAPETFRNAPKITKRIIKVAHTLKGIPKIPMVVAYRLAMTLSYTLP